MDGDDPSSRSESADVGLGWQERDSTAENRDRDAARRDRGAEDRDARARDRDEAASDLRHDEGRQDQYWSDLDQRGNESDQRIADDDQRAADRDLAAGGDMEEHRRGALARQRTRRERAVVSRSRDEATAVRQSADGAQRQGHGDFQFAERDRAHAANDRREAADDRIEAARERETSVHDRLDSEAAAQRALETLESMSDAFHALDREWRFTYVNPQSEAILERPRETLIGKVIWEEFPQALGTAFEEAMRRAARDRVPVRLEETFEPLGRTLEMRIHPVTEGVAVYFSDVTDERERDARHRQAERMEMLGRLTAGVAHDFNNYLLVIRTFAELGQAASNDEVVTGFFDQVAAASRQGTALTRQLRAFGREQQLDASEVDLNDIVGDLWSLLQGMVPEGITLILDPSPRPVHVYVDRTQIEQVVLNLVVNARDAIEASGSITVTTANDVPDEVTHDEPRAFGWLQVRDSGSGIPEDIRPHIFDPFFTTKAAETGTGLGLATTYRIVTQSGGSIIVDSAVSAGTTMTVALPRSPLPV